MTSPPLLALRPLFSFYGSKWRLAPKYPVPQFETIIEPFAGSAGYSGYYPEKQIILIVKDPIICAVWRYLIAATPSDILALPLLQNNDNVNSFDIPQAAKYLIGFWLNHASRSPCNVPSSWMREGNHINSFWGNQIRKRIAEQVLYIKHWQIYEGDYTIAPDVRATWFIDPPYQLRGDIYKCSARSIDFNALGQWTLARDGQLICCENVGAEWLPFEPFHIAKSQTVIPSKEAIFIR